MYTYVKIMFVPYIYQQEVKIRLQICSKQALVEFLAEILKLLYLSGIET